MLDPVMGERDELAHLHANTQIPVPLMSGAAREFSEPFDSFWCCVGIGMESHSKHGDSMYWQDDGTLYVNPIVPWTLDGRERDARITLEARYPFGESH